MICRVPRRPTCHKVLTHRVSDLNNNKSITVWVLFQQNWNSLKSHDKTVNESSSLHRGFFFNFSSKINSRPWVKNIAFDLYDIDITIPTSREHRAKINYFIWSKTCNWWLDYLKLKPHLWVIYIHWPLIWQTHNSCSKMCYNNNSLNGSVFWAVSSFLHNVQHNFIDIKI